LIETPIDLILAGERSLQLILTLLDGEFCVV
jgi:hypothetical protein